MFDRIKSDPRVLGGKPCVGGTRISVEFLLELAASGASHDDIIAGYPQLSADDIGQAFRYAARALQHDTMIAVEVVR